MMQRVRNLIADPDLWLVLIVQTLGVVAMTATLAFSDSARQGLPLLCYEAAMAALLALGMSVVLSSWRGGQRRPLVLSLLMAVAAFAVGMRLVDPRIAAVAVIAGVRGLLDAAHIRGARRGLLPLVVASALFSIARISDEIFLWSAGVSDSLWAARFSFESLMGTRLAAQGFGYARGFEGIFVLGFAAAAIVSSRGFRRLAAAGLLVLVVTRYLRFLGNLSSFDFWVVVAPCLVVAGVLVSLGPTGGARPLRFGRLALCSALGMIGGGLLYWISPEALPDQTSAVLLKGNYSIEIPDVEKPERAKSASLGFFYRFLDEAVDDLATVDHISESTLEGRQSLLICNLGRQLDPAEMERILSFVRNGGRLCVLGDHTDIFGVMKCTNPLIENFGISLRFDSAIPFGKNWIGDLEARWHPSTAALESADQIRISVGASLDIRGDARPLILARRGYSDRGDRSAPQRAYLGSWSYEADSERMGGLVLAADARYGQGHVVVFGDTAFTQELSFSTSWRFVASLLRDQLSATDAWPSRWRLGLGLLAFCCAAWLSAIFRLQPVPVALVALLSITSAGACREIVHRSLGADPLLPARVAWIDFEEGANLDVVSKESNEAGGFGNALMAAGFVPLISGTGEGFAPRLGDVVVLPSGGGPLSAGAYGRLRSFVARGGRVLAFAGREDRRRFALPLEDQELRIGDEPLGICPGAQMGEAYQEELTMPAFRQAWPIEAAASAKAEEMVSCFGRPVIVEVSIGKGRWTWIADSRFGWNENFKRGEAFSPRNFRFLNSLLKRRS